MSYAGQRKLNDPKLSVTIAVNQANIQNTLSGEDNIWRGIEDRDGCQRKDGDRANEALPRGKREVEGLIVVRKTLKITPMRQGKSDPAAKIKTTGQGQAGRVDIRKKTKQGHPQSNVYCVASPKKNLPKNKD